MAKLMKMLQPLQSEYVDRRFDGTKEEYFKQLELSSTLYIGNLSFYTTEDQIYELFNKVGVVHRVIMGLDRNTKTPCGFCFVIYHTRADALAAVRYLNGTKLDNRQLRVDIDYGFEEGRQFGRGRSGGQVRDEFRTDFDADRGGYGRVVQQQVASQQLAMWQEMQAGALLGAGVLPGAVGGAVFFGQDQREALGQHAAEPAAAQGPEAGAVAEAEPEAEDAEQQQEIVNPRTADRGRELEEDEEEALLHRAKRRRVGSQVGASTAAPAAAAAAAAEGGQPEADASLGDAAPVEGEDEEQQQQAEEEQDAAFSESDDADAAEEQAEFE